MGSTVERPPVQGLPGATAVLRVGYDGTGFSGYAIQEKQPHVRTVAGELRTALRMLLRRDVELTCAGRTDAGVHARAQHVSFAVDGREALELDGGRLLRSLGAILPRTCGSIECLGHPRVSRPGSTPRRATTATG